MKIIEKPSNNEFQANEPKLGKLIPDDGLLLSHLSENIQKTKSFILAIPVSKLMYRYAENKWTIKEVISHLIDMERMYSYRMLRFARNDQTVSPGFDAENYVLYSGANEREIVDLLAELEAVRNATILLLNGLTKKALLSSGNVNGYPVTVRALAYHIAGHELHHISIIKERYLNNQ
jgi:uncharacterized damage-inducible protein DinB